jgi:hypothetical protein
LAEILQNSDRVLDKIDRMADADNHGNPNMLAKLFNSAISSLRRAVSTASHILKAATIAACLTVALAGLDKLTGHTYASTDLSSILNIGNNLVQASFANIDPLTYLQSSYTWESAIPNPHPTWGKITGADGIDNGTKAMILWENGKSATYSSDMSSQISTFDFGVSNATGIAEVPPGFLGFDKAKYAVSDFGNVTIYSASGSELGHRGVQSSTINDIEFNPMNQKLLVSTQRNGTGYLNDDGTLTGFSGGSDSPEIINLTQDNGVQIDNLYQSSNWFFRLLQDDSHSGNAFRTNLGGAGIQGIAYTKDKVIMPSANGFYIYDKLAFQPFMNYSLTPSVILDPMQLVVPNPTTQNILMPNPEFGTVQSVQVLDDGAIAVLYSHGRVSKMTPSLSYELSSFNSVDGATGIAVVPSEIGNGGVIAVSAGKNIYYYTDDGNLMSRANAGVSIDELCYDWNQGRTLVTGQDGTYAIAADNTKTLIDSAGYLNIEEFRMPLNYWGLRLLNETFNAVDQQGNIKSDIPPVTVNISGEVNGSTFTKQHGYYSTPEGVIIAAPAPFQDKIIFPNYRPHTLISDINLDGIVDPNDLAILSTLWLTQNKAADFNKDGIVNHPDFSIMSSEWGKKEDW